MINRILVPAFHDDWMIYSSWRFYSYYIRMTFQLIFDVNFLPSNILSARSEGMSQSPVVLEKRARLRIRGMCKSFLEESLGVVLKSHRERNLQKLENDLIKLLRKAQEQRFRDGETTRFGSARKIILIVREPLISYKDYINWKSPLGKSSRGYNGTLCRERDFGCSIIRGISFIVRKC